MKYLPNGCQMKRADSYTIREVGIPSLTLMERAAAACVDVIQKKQPELTHICIVCGSGNNGGDGFAVARMFQEKGFQVTAVMAGNPEHCTEETVYQKELFEKAGGIICDEFIAGEYSIIIDAVFGVGLSREICGKYYDIIRKMNEADAVKAAIDIPSGISADTGAVMGIAFRADYTVTMQCKKPGILLSPGREYAGEVIVADIGISERPLDEDKETAYMLEPEDYKGLIPKRRPDSNKGTYGRILMISGSKGMSGAAYLNGLAAYRTGAGLVQIYTHEENRIILQTQLPEAIIQTYYDYNEEQIKKMLKWADVVCVGSGLGTDNTADRILRAVLENVETSCVIDADGLNLIAADKGLLKKIKDKKVILTPHLKEFARLTDREVADIRADRIKALKDFVEETRVTCVLKDSRTILLSPDERACINMSGCQALAKAGSGDVLAGVLAGLLGQGLCCRDAAALGVYLHGRAGEYAKEEYGSYGILAREIADAVGKVLKGWEASVS